MKRSFLRHHLVYTHLHIYAHMYVCYTYLWSKLYVVLLETYQQMKFV